MIVWLKGGQDARIALPFMVLKTAECNYRIQNVPDIVPGVSYCTKKKVG